jgi:hypothetical protein
MVTRPDLLVGGDWSWFVVPDADLLEKYWLKLIFWIRVIEADLLGEKILI